MGPFRFVCDFGCGRFRSSLDQRAATHSAEAVVAGIFISAIGAAQDVSFENLRTQSRKFVFGGKSPTGEDSSYKLEASSPFAPKEDVVKLLLDYDNPEKRCAASGLRDARLYTFVANVLLSMALQEKQETEKTGVHQVKC